MDSLFFPQLASGALVQYPVKKTKLVRTVKNVLPDGSMILLSDPNGRHLIWQLTYTDLAFADIQSLQVHFASCAGPLRAFTFIDPTENMLVWSSDLRMAPWRSVSSIRVEPGLADPDGGTAGLTVTNLGQATLQISQTLVVPASYRYCFSLYVSSAEPSQVALTRSGPSFQESATFAVGPEWSRLVSSGQLADPGTGFTVAIGLRAGQQLGVYGLQLEPQVSPSRYRPTTSTGGVFANAHWGIEQLTTAAGGLDRYSASFSVEATVRD